jgi:hypothetical protein
MDVEFATTTSAHCVSREENADRGLINPARKNRATGSVGWPGRPRL